MAIGVDERVELLAIIFRLAGAGEFSGRFVPDYADAIQEHFGRFADHEAVAAARELRSDLGISHNAVMDFALHLTHLPELAERRPFEEGQLDRRWNAAAARDFAAKVRRFAVDSNAAAFFPPQQPIYDVAVRRMRTLIESEIDLQWLRDFYGGSAAERFHILIAPSNGTWAYGPRFSGADGSHDFYAVMSVYQADDEGLPAFPVTMASHILHEFGHSYVNPVIEENYPRLAQAGDALQEHFGEDMRPLGYTNGLTIIHESIIRAGVARYKLAHQGERAARRELARQRELGFVWVDDLYDLLGAYQERRDLYPRFRDFYPAVEGYFAQLRPRIPALAAEQEARRPKLVEMSPPNGGSDVDPATSQITFRFDRPMVREGGWSLMFGPRGRDAFPPTRGSPSFDESGTVLTLPVTLRPDTAYEFGLNAPGASGFRSADGIALRPILVTFTTGPAR